jgi:phosphate-selective porin OprO/OprP
MRSIVFLLILCCLPAASAAGDEGGSGRVGGEHLYWEEGLHLDVAKGNFSVNVGARVHADAGWVATSGDLDSAFPDLEGSAASLRRLTLNMSGRIFHHLEYVLEIDFANIREIEDNWIRWTKHPVVARFRFGNITEPFSLEELMSSNTLPFMEVSVPTDAFAHSRNIGVPYNDTAFDGRMSLAAGFFLNTGSFSDVGDASTQISEANGWNVVGRVTGLPWYEDDGRRLLHLGLGYSYKSFDDGNRYQAFPESRLVDEKLVDTDVIAGAEEENILDLEAALAFGPLTLSGETFLSFVGGEDSLFFWGGYLSGSYFLTGERRLYNKTKGVFTSETPLHSFSPLKGRWGAWELAARLSYTDLDDGEVGGGRELNATAGLNVYLGSRTRVMFSYIHARVKDRDTEPAVGDGTAQYAQTRFQYVF